MKEAKGTLLMLAGVAVFIIVIGFFTSPTGGQLKIPFLKQPSPTPITKTIKVADEELQVYVANSKETRQKGLSGKESLGEKQGMLFVFEELDTKPSFWMKEMEFSIDIIWINDNQISQIDENVPPQPDVAEKDLTLYPADDPVDYVLETAAGFIEKYDIKVGDEVDLSQAL